MIQNQTKFWSPAAFLRMGFLVSDCPWFWCSCETGSSADHGTEMGPKGCSTWPELSALYHSIPVPQKLHSAASLENFFLIHSSCFLFSYLLLVGVISLWFFSSFFLSGTFFVVFSCFSFFSLKWFGECDALCWQSICGLKNEERCFCPCLGVGKLPKISSWETYSNPCRKVETWMIYD